MTLPSSSRFGAFFSRVETEREALSIINAPNSSRPALHGLTTVAIDRWAGEVAKVSPITPAAAEVVRLLQRISVRTGADADQSRVVFAGESPATLPVHDLIDELRAACDQWRSAAQSRDQSQF